MRKETQDALRAVNRRFYQERASEFSRTRERPWSGWGEILKRVEALLPERPRVLDVGCGNGRFGRFLEDRLGRDFDYVGVEESPLGLAEARRRLRGDVVLVEHDFLESPFPPSVSEGKFDWIALFGVLHHVPGRENRTRVLKRLSAVLAPGGILTFSLWRFDRDPCFSKKVVPWEEFRARTGVEIDLEDLEPGDHILTWGGKPHAYRFCHLMSEEEEDDLKHSLPPELLLRFESGREPNRYFLFRYPQRA